MRYVPQDEAQEVRDLLKENNIDFLSVYNKFKSKHARNFIFDNFIYGDIHWNQKGTKLIYEEVINKINF